MDRLIKPLLILMTAVACFFAGLLCAGYGIKETPQELKQDHAYFEIQRATIYVDRDGTWVMTPESEVKEKK
jgi:hypothetical protein